MGTNPVNTQNIIDVNSNIQYFFPHGANDTRWKTFCEIFDIYSEPKYDEITLNKYANKWMLMYNAGYKVDPEDQMNGDFIAFIKDIAKYHSDIFKKDSLFDTLETVDNIVAKATTFTDEQKKKSEEKSIKDFESKISGKVATPTIPAPPMNEVINRFVFGLYSEYGIDLFAESETFLNLGDEIHKQLDQVKNKEEKIIELFTGYIYLKAGGYIISADKRAKVIEQRDSELMYESFEKEFKSFYSTYYGYKYILINTFISDPQTIKFVSNIVDKGTNSKIFGLSETFNNYVYGCEKLRLNIDDMTIAQVFDDFIDKLNKKNPCLNISDDLTHKIEETNTATNISNPTSKTEITWKEWCETFKREVSLDTSAITYTGITKNNRTIKIEKKLQTIAPTFFGLISTNKSTIDLTEEYYDLICGLSPLADEKKIANKFIEKLDRLWSLTYPLEIVKRKKEQLRTISKIITTITPSAITAMSGVTEDLEYFNSQMKYYYDHMDDADRNYMRLLRRVFSWYTFKQDGFENPERSKNIDESVVDNSYDCFDAYFIAKKMEEYDDTCRTTFYTYLGSGVLNTRYGTNIGRIKEVCDRLNNIQNYKIQQIFIGYIRNMLKSDKTPGTYNTFDTINTKLETEHYMFYVVLQWTIKMAEFRTDVDNDDLVQNAFESVHDEISKINYSHESLRLLGAKIDNFRVRKIFDYFLVCLRSKIDENKLLEFLIENYAIAIANETTNDLQYIMELKKQNYVLGTIFDEYLRTTVPNFMFEDLPTIIYYNAYMSHEQRFVVQDVSTLGGFARFHLYLRLTLPEYISRHTDLIKGGDAFMDYISSKFEIQHYLYNDIGRSVTDNLNEIKKILEDKTIKLDKQVRIKLNKLYKEMDTMKTSLNQQIPYDIKEHLEISQSLKYCVSQDGKFKSNLSTYSEICMLPLVENMIIKVDETLKKYMGTLGDNKSIVVEIKKQDSRLKDLIHIGLPQFIANIPSSDDDVNKMISHEKTKKHIIPPISQHPVETQQHIIDICETCFELVDKYNLYKTLGDNTINIFAAGKLLNDLQGKCNEYIGFMKGIDASQYVIGRMIKTQYNEILAGIKKEVTNPNTAHNQITGYIKNRLSNLGITSFSFQPAPADHVPVVYDFIKPPPSAIEYTNCIGGDINIDPLIKLLEDKVMSEIIAAEVQRVINEKFIHTTDLSLVGRIVIETIRECVDIVIALYNNNVELQMIYDSVGKGASKLVQLLAGTLAKLDDINDINDAFFNNVLQDTKYLTRMPIVASILSIVVHDKGPFANLPECVALKGLFTAAAKNDLNIPKNCVLRALEECIGSFADVFIKKLLGNIVGIKAFDFSVDNPLVKLDGKITNNLTTYQQLVKQSKKVRRFLLSNSSNLSTVTYNVLNRNDTDLYRQLQKNLLSARHNIGVVQLLRQFISMNSGIWDKICEGINSDNGVAIKILFDAHMNNYADSPITQISCYLSMFYPEMIDDFETFGIEMVKHSNEKITAMHIDDKKVEELKQYYTKITQLLNEKKNSIDQSVLKKLLSEQQIGQQQELIDIKTALTHKEKHFSDLTIFDFMTHYDTTHYDTKGISIASLYEYIEQYNIYIIALPYVQTSIVQISKITTKKEYVTVSAIKALNYLHTYKPGFLNKQFDPVADPSDEIKKCVDTIAANEPVAKQYVIDKIGSTTPNVVQISRIVEYVDGVLQNHKNLAAVNAFNKIIAREMYDQAMLKAQAAFNGDPLYDIIKAIDNTYDDSAVGKIFATIILTLIASIYVVQPQVIQQIIIAYNKNIEIGKPKAGDPKSDGFPPLLADNTELDINVVMRIQVPQPKDATKILNIFKEIFIGELDKQTNVKVINNINDCCTLNYLLTAIEHAKNAYCRPVSQMNESLEYMYEVGLQDNQQILEELIKNFNPAFKKANDAMDDYYDQLGKFTVNHLYDARSAPFPIIIASTFGSMYNVFFADGEEKAKEINCACMMRMIDGFFAPPPAYTAPRKGNVKYHQQTKHLANESRYALLKDNKIKVLAQNISTIIIHFLSYFISSDAKIQAQIMPDPTYGITISSITDGSKVNDIGRITDIRHNIAVAPIQQPLNVIQFDYDTIKTTETYDELILAISNATSYSLRQLCVDSTHADVLIPPYIYMDVNTLDIPHPDEKKMQITNIYPNDTIIASAFNITIEIYKKSYSDSDKESIILNTKKNAYMYEALHTNKSQQFSKTLFPPHMHESSIYYHVTFTTQILDLFDELYVSLDKMTTSPTETIYQNNVGRILSLYYDWGMPFRAYDRTRNEFERYTNSKTSPYEEIQEQFRIFGETNKNTVGLFGLIIPDLESYKNNYRKLYQIIKDIYNFYIKINKWDITQKRLILKVFADRYNMDNSDINKVIIELNENPFYPNNLIGAPAPAAPAAAPGAPAAPAAPVQMKTPNQQLKQLFVDTLERAIIPFNSIGNELIDFTETRFMGDDNVSTRDTIKSQLAKLDNYDIVDINSIDNLLDYVELVNNDIVRSTCSKFVSLKYEIDPLFGFTIRLREYDMKNTSEDLYGPIRYYMNQLLTRTEHKTPTESFAQFIELMNILRQESIDINKPFVIANNYLSLFMSFIKYRIMRFWFATITKYNKTYKLGTQPPDIIEYDFVQKKFEEFATANAITEYVPNENLVSEFCSFITSTIKQYSPTPAQSPTVGELFESSNQNICIYFSKYIESIREIIDIEIKDMDKIPVKVVKNVTSDTIGKKFTAFISRKKINLDKILDPYVASNGAVDTGPKFSLFTEGSMTAIEKAYSEKIKMPRSKLKSIIRKDIETFTKKNAALSPQPGGTMYVPTNVQLKEFFDNVITGYGQLTPLEKSLYNKLIQIQTTHGAEVEFDKVTTSHTKYNVYLRHIDVKDDSGVVKSVPYFSQYIPTNDKLRETYIKIYDGSNAHYLSISPSLNFNPKSIEQHIYKRDELNRDQEYIIKQIGDKYIKFDKYGRDKEFGPPICNGTMYPGSDYECKVFYKKLMSGNLQELIDSINDATFKPLNDGKFVEDMTPKDAVDTIHKFGFATLDVPYLPTGSVIRQMESVESWRNRNRAILGEGDNNRFINFYTYLNNIVLYINGNSFILNKTKKVPNKMFAQFNQTGGCLTCEDKLKFLIKFNKYQRKQCLHEHHKIIIDTTKVIHTYNSILREILKSLAQQNIKINKLDIVKINKYLERINIYSENLTKLSCILEPAYASLGDLLMNDKSRINKQYERGIKVMNAIDDKCKYCSSKISNAEKKILLVIGKLSGK